MDLGHIERGTKLIIYEEIQKRAISDEHEAVFRSFEEDKFVIVHCSWLYDNYDRLSLGAQLNVSYGTEATVYFFMGQARERLRSNGLVKIEKLSEIVEKNRRQVDRDEIKVNVSVYGLPEAKLSSETFELPPNAPDFSDVSFDISSSGLCVITNTLLSSKHDPNYLVDFSLSEKDRFLLPARVMRKSNYPHTKIGRYDYGFQFIFDKMPEEKDKLTTAILKKKLQKR